MQLAVVSHKLCWVDPGAPAGYATDGGFAKQIDALAELFDHTTVHVPVTANPPASAAATQSPFTHPRLSVEALPELRGVRWARRARMPVWLLRVLGPLLGGVRRADAVHVPIPGDIGTFGIVIAELFRRPLFVRYCGNWFRERTMAERAWHAYMRRFAGGRRVFLATGGAAEPPHPPNPDLRWIFSASLREQDLPARSTTRPPLGDGLRLISVGRQEPYKGTGAVIDALPELARRYDVEYHVVGAGSGLAGFVERAEQLGVADAVVFHGSLHHDQVIDALLAAHVFVFPTDSEGFPKVVGEALACGVPVVASPVSVIPTIVSDEVGALLEDHRPETIVRAVSAVCDDHARRSANAVEVGRRFTLDRWRHEIGELLADAWGPLRSVRDQAGAPPQG